jgi:hypothetical protein
MLSLKNDSLTRTFEAGWALLGLMTVQVVTGSLRPRAGAGEKPQSITEVAVKTLNGINNGSIKAVWEASNKFLGVGTLALALWQMQSGLKFWKDMYGVKDYLVPYWIWILILLSGLLLLKIFAFRKGSENLSKDSGVGNPLDDLTLSNQ